MPQASRLATTAVPQVLLVEDNPADARLLHEALQEASPGLVLKTASTVAAAWEYLEGHKNGDALPNLIILDLNLPGAPGFELLDRLRNTWTLSWIPVVVLTSSSREQDVQQARGARADAYFVKPLDLRGYLQLAADLGHLWIGRPGGR